MSSARRRREAASVPELGFTIILSTIEASSDQDSASAAYSAAFNRRSFQTQQVLAAVKSDAASATATMSRRMVNRGRGSLTAANLC
jgi:hypothetical protein